MIIYEHQAPTRQTSFPTLIVGFPGLRGQEEEHRIKQQLAYLREQGHNTLLIDYASIERKWDGKLLVCRPDMNAEDVGETIEHHAEDLNVKPSRIGVISNSMGTILATKYIMGLKPTDYPSAFASYSPLPGWRQFSTEPARRHFETGQADLPVTSVEDASAGRKRVIAKESLQELATLDCLKELAARNPRIFSGMSALTIFGNRDTISSPEGMKQFHRLLGGTEEGLIEIYANHDLLPFKEPPTEKVPDVNGLIYRFIEKRLPVAG